MRQSSATEVSTGLFVLLGFAALLFMVTQITSREFSLGTGSNYRVEALFENIGGLKAGAPVSMSGVTVGRVESITYDQTAYKAKVTLRFDATFDRIPDDSNAAILTSGLLGGQYVGIAPGGADGFLKDGSKIEFVQDAIVLENLINRFMASMSSRLSDGAAGAAKE
jgi:phospholipid/cholesterol/gamma-HCH transport system substrate-binding protein